MLLSLIQTTMWKWRLLTKRCKYCRYLHFIWGDPSRCRCAITWKRIDLENSLEWYLCKYFEKKEEDIDI